jgi:hypothetical protein
MNDNMQSVVHVRVRRRLALVGYRGSLQLSTVAPRRFTCSKAQPNFIHDNLNSHIELVVRTGCIVPLNAWCGAGHV